MVPSCVIFLLQHPQPLSEWLETSRSLRCLADKDHESLSAETLQESRDVELTGFHYSIT
jgi:hypothetical protein